MGIVSTAIGQNFVRDFSQLTGTAFQKKCFEYLSDLISDLRYAAELKKVDRKGVDIYKISNSVLYNYDIAFQCKGFEERFDKPQFDLCIDSISALRKYRVRIDKYFMVINLPSKYFDLNLKKELVRYLKNLESDMIVRKAVLLDAENFANYLGELIKQNLSLKITKANKRFAKDYVHSMNQRFYFEDVSYKINQKNGKNPSEYILTKTIDRTTNTLRSTGKNWILVISEFGFGKTSLLIHLFDRFKFHKQRCLYVPASLFQRNDFIYTTNFANQLLQIIEGQEIDFSLHYNRFRSRVLHYRLQSENDQIVLMIDGLDEHEDLFNQDVLRVFFKHISVFKCPIIFTIRKEMWDERNGNFMAALGKGNEKNKVKLFLEEWNNFEIISYIDIFIKSINVNRHDRTHVLKFRELVEKMSYEKYYGDIPKRPLFLEMLVSDIRVNNIQRRNISELYSIYLKNKFLLDRQGAFASHFSKRPLSVKEDVNKTLAIIFAILSKIAIKMIIGVDANHFAILSSYVEEKQIELILHEEGIPKTVEMMLNSVLVPSGIRLNNNLSLKFAHKSFHEFFLARAIFNHMLFCLENNSEMSDLNIIHSEGVNQFLIGFVETEIADDDFQIMKLQIKRTYEKIVVGSLAEKLLKV